jgi:hypothetical protein
MKQGVEQATARLVTSAKARLQPVAERHQLIDLGDDAVLLGQWRNRAI